MKFELKNKSLCMHVFGPSSEETSYIMAGTAKEFSLAEVFHFARGIKAVCESNACALVIDGEEVPAAKTGEVLTALAKADEDRKNPPAVVAPVETPAEPKKK